MSQKNYTGLAPPSFLSRCWMRWPSSEAIPSIIAKEKAHQLYYVVESAGVDGKPRIVQQTYLGTAERVAALVKDRTALLPSSATTLDFGLPGALWLAAQQSGV